MSEYARALWGRAVRALETGAMHVADDPDAAASRAYYAAFHAVSALFAMRGQSFHKHAALEAAVHRDLIKAGVWPSDLGGAYSWLSGLRSTGDYGAEEHVSREDAVEAVETARRILRAVRASHPETFGEFESAEA